MRKMTQEEEKKFWLHINVKQIQNACEILGKVKLYQFEKEDKDAFIDAVKILDDLVKKYDVEEKS